MTAKLSVIFFILLCLEVGIFLILLPWWTFFGFFGDWGDNYFLLYAAQKTGLQGLQHAVASGWVRGAVSGVGLLNLGVAIWEIAHFNQTVSALENSSAKAPASTNNGVQPQTANQLPDHERGDDPRHQSLG